MLLSAYGRFFFCWDLRIGVRVRLWEVSVYWRLSIQSFLKEMAGTSDRCPFMGGVRLREVSAYGRCPLVGVRLYTEISDLATNADQRRGRQIRISAVSFARDYEL